MEIERGGSAYAGERRRKNEDSALKLEKKKKKDSDLNSRTSSAGLEPATFSSGN